MAEGIDRELLQCTSQLPANCVHHSCSPFLAARYHSLVIKRETIPEDLEITAWTEDGNIMGVRHKSRPHCGLQFHPESVLTPSGKKLICNWIEDVVACTR